MMHTKEPWDYIESRTLIHIESIPDGHSHIASLPKTKEYDARRIVACVNACDGLSTDMLERAGANIPTKTALNGYLEMKAQRDELLTLIKQWAEVLDDDGDELGVAAEMHISIARIEASK